MFSFVVVCETLALEPSAVRRSVISDGAFRDLSLIAKMLFLWRVREASVDNPDAQTRPPFVTDEAFARASIQLAPRLA